MIRFGLISDTHIGNPRPGYFHQEPLADYPPLFQTLAEFCREEKLDFLCHAGDVIDNGSKEQMSAAAELFKQIPCPVFAVPGNHDLMNRDSAKWLPEQIPGLFPEGTVDYTVIKNGLRLDFLTTNWCGIPRFWDAEHQDPYFLPEQLELLDQGPQDLPRVLITHSPACGLPTEQTGFPEVYHAPPGAFEKMLLNLAERKKISMILGGHNHMNIGVHNKTFALVTASAFREMPFELKVIEFEQGVFSLKTCSLAEKAGINLPYNYNKTHVQGRGCDREFQVEVS